MSNAHEAARVRAFELERACEFGAAALAALDAEDAGWAARLAVLAKRDDLFERSESALVTLGPAACARVANDLLARGLDVHAGRLFALAGEPGNAGEAFGRGGDAARAASEFERAGRPADGAKALERALRDNPENDRLRRALAELLARHGRVEAAIKVAQQMRDGSERAATLPLLARSLRAIGLSEAADEIARELRKLGIDPAGVEASPPNSEPVNPVATSKTVLFGRYEVAREVAKTPHAHLFEAVDRITGLRVAVKLLASSARGSGRDALVRFEREAQALLKLKHPTTVTLHAFVAEGPALVLEWMSGGSLASLLAREAFAPSRAVEIACSVLTALGEAHRLGILHRDVKPSNVLFDAVGTPKLADFGAAHLGDLSSTVTAGAIGTISYMSPEQRLGRPASVSSDIYSVGALLYEMITRHMASPQKGSFKERAPSDVHPELLSEHDALIAALLAEDPQHRPENAFVARERIEALTWPSLSIDSAAPVSRRISNHPAAMGERLAPPRDLLDNRDSDTLAFDTVTERHIRVIPLSDETAARLRSFARVADATLATVLRAARTEGVAWTEAPTGTCLADSNEAVGPGDLGAIRHALARLHQAGGAHGAVDRAHLYRSPAGLFLAFPRDFERPASPTDDLRALETLGRPV